MSKDDAIRKFCDELMGATSLTIFSEDAGAILAEAYPIIVELLRERNLLARQAPTWDDLT